MERLDDVIKTMHNDGLTLATMASKLNDMGVTAPGVRRPWDGSLVSKYCREKLGLRRNRFQQKGSGKVSVKAVISKISAADSKFNDNEVQFLLGLLLNA